MIQEEIGKWLQEVPDIYKHFEKIAEDNYIVDSWPTIEQMEIYKIRDLLHFLQEILENSRMETHYE